MDIVDVSLSAILFLSFAIGFPANLVSLNFFLNKAKRVPNCIYLVMSAADGLTTLLLVPVGKFLYHVQTMIEFLLVMVEYFLESGRNCFISSKIIFMFVKTNQCREMLQRVVIRPNSTKEI